RSRERDAGRKRKGDQHGVGVIRARIERAHRERDVLSELRVERAGSETDPYVCREDDEREQSGGSATGAGARYADDRHEGYGEVASRQRYDELRGREKDGRARRP